MDTLGDKDVGNEAVVDSRCDRGGTDGAESSGPESVDPKLTQETSSAVFESLDGPKRQAFFNVFFNEAERLLEKWQKVIEDALLQFKSDPVRNGDSSGEVDSSTVDHIADCRELMQKLFSLVEEKHSAWSSEQKPSREDFVDFISGINNGLLSLHGRLDLAHSFLKEISEVLKESGADGRLAKLTSAFNVSFASAWSKNSTWEESGNWLRNSLKRGDSLYRFSLPFPGMGVLVVDDDKLVTDSTAKAIERAGGRAFVVLPPFKDLQTSIGENGEIMVVLMDYDLGSTKGPLLVPYCFDTNADVLVIGHTSAAGDKNVKEEYRESKVQHVVRKGAYAKASDTMIKHPPIAAKLLEILESLGR